MTLDELYRRACARLAAAGLPTPELDARWLVADALGIETQAVVLAGRRSPPVEAIERVEAAITRRLSGEPVDRILGSREFWGLGFRLSPATLSPRPDSETIVLAALGAFATRDEPLRVLDLGTGTGALLVALLHERQAAYGIGVDRSIEAVMTARLNAADNGVAQRASFLVGDWACALAGPFDLIVANPPYVAKKDLAGLQREVRDHDPMLALDGGTDGLDAYRVILPQAARLLARGGVVVLELGCGQELEVATLARTAGLAVEDSVRRDLAGVARALVARRGPG